MTNSCCGPECTTGYKPKQKKIENLVSDECAKKPGNDDIENGNETEEKQEEEEVKYALLCSILQIFCSYRTPNMHMHIFHYCTEAYTSLRENEQRILSGT